MPSPQEEFPIVGDDPPNLRQFVIPKPSYICQGDRLKPKLRVPPRVSHVNVCRLTALHAEEEKPIAANSEYRRHSVSLPRSTDMGEASVAEGSLPNTGLTPAYRPLREASHGNGAGGDEPFLSRVDLRIEPLEGPGSEQ